LFVVNGPSAPFAHFLTLAGLLRYQRY